MTPFVIATLLCDVKLAGLACCSCHHHLNLHSWLLVPTNSSTNVPHMPTLCCLSCS
jgi:hypothetical protein